MTQTLTEQRTQALTALLQANPLGVSLDRAAAEIGASKSVAGDVLGIMRRAGQVQCRREGMASCWWATEHSAASLAAWNEREKARRKAQGAHRRRADQDRMQATGSKPNASQRKTIGRVLDAFVEGITSVEIAQRMGLGLHRARILLTVARRFGAVSAVQHGRGMVWVTPEEAQRRAEAAAKKVQPAKRVKPDDDEAHDPRLYPVRRHVEVGESVPLPFQLQAPASVFHLGAML